MKKEKLTRTRLTKVSQNGIEMLPKVVMGCNAAHLNATKIIKLHCSSPGQTVHGEV